MLITPRRAARLSLLAITLAAIALPASAQDVTGAVKNTAQGAADTVKGATAAAAKALTGGAGESMTVVVTAVRGMVQVRASENDPWLPAKPGQELTQGAEFRTGPRSAVEFKIPPDQTCVLDRLGTMKVLAAIRQGDKVKTDLGMKYGRTRYNIEAGGELEHESTIRSPSATLAVRGTDVTFADEMGFPAMAQWNAIGFDQARHDSQAQLTNNDTGQTQTFGGDDTDSSTNTGSRSAAANALTQTTTGGPRGQTSNERQTSTAAGGGNTAGGARLGGELQNQQQRTTSIRQAFDNQVQHTKRNGVLEVRLTWNDNRTDLELYTQHKLSTGATERIASANPADDPLVFDTPPPVSVVAPRKTVFSGGSIVQTSAGSAAPGGTFTEVIRFDQNGKYPVITDGFIGVKQVNQTGPPPSGGSQAPTAFTVEVLVDGNVVRTETGNLTQGGTFRVEQFKTPTTTAPPPGGGSI